MGIYDYHKVSQAVFSFKNFVEGKQTQPPSLIHIGNVNITKTFAICNTNTPVQLQLLSFRCLQTILSQMEGEEPPKDSEQPLIINPTKKPALVLSEYIDEYLQEFSKVPQMPQQKSSFFGSKVYYNKEKPLPFSFKIANDHVNFEIVQLNVTIGAFTLELRLLNLDKPSPLTKKLPIGEGNFGSIYCLQFLGQEIVVKSLTMKENTEQCFQKTLWKAIRQYSIAKISGLLSCGAPTITCFGFDMLVFSDRIEFALQKCEQLTKFTQQDYLKLLSKLQILHRHKIIHMDIKPDNIMALGQNNLVLIDFGLSQIIMEEVGLKTQTSFYGTVSFVSKQMLGLFSIDCKVGCVDLYYNDLICLKKSYNGLMSKLEKFESSLLTKIAFMESEQQSNKNEELKEYLLSLFKHQSFYRPESIDALLSLQNQLMIKQFPAKVLSFLRELLPSQLIETLVLEKLSGLSHLQQYQNFLARVNLKHSFLLLRKSKGKSNNPFEHRYQLKKLQEEIMSISELLKHLKSKQLIKTLGNKQQYYQLVFDFLRFDRKNADIAQKKQLVQYLRTFFGQKQTVPFSTQLSPIREIFEQLLSFFLRKPFSSMLHDILFQAFLTDANVLSQLLQLQRMAQDQQLGLNELIKLLYSYSLMSYLYTLKHKFEDHSLGLRLIKQYKQNQAQLKQNLRRYCSEICKGQSLLLIQCLDALCCKENKGRQHLQRLYEKVEKNQHLQRDVTEAFLKCLLLSYIRKFNHSHKSQRSHDKVYQFIKAKINDNRLIVKSIRLEESLVWHSVNITFRGIDQSIVSKKKMQMINQINCRQISDNIFMLLVINQQRLERHLKQITATCFDDRRFKQFYQAFDFFLKKALGKIDMVSKTDILLELAQKYLDFIQFYKKDQISLNNQMTPLQVQEHYEIKKIINQSQEYFFSIINYFGNIVSKQMKQLKTLIVQQYWKNLQNKSRQIQGCCAQENERYDPEEDLHLMIPIIIESEQQQNLQLFLSCCKQQLRVSAQIDMIKAAQQYIHVVLWLRYRISLILKQYNYSRTKLPKFKKITQFIDRVLFFVWQRCQLQNYFSIYFNKNREYSYLITDTFQVLINKNMELNYCESFNFLQKIALHLGLESKRQNIYLFRYNLCLIWFKFSDFFNVAQLNEHLVRITWKKRYQIMLYEFSLILHQQQPKKLALVLGKIANNLDKLCLAGRSFILSNYILSHVNLCTIIRKRIFIYFKQYFKINQRFYPFNSIDIQGVPIIWFRRSKLNVYKTMLKNKLIKMLQPQKVSKKNVSSQVREQLEFMLKRTW